MKPAMSATENRGPGYQNHPGYAVDTQAFSAHIVVTAGGQKVADSHHAILLTETDHSPVYYLPHEDIRFDLLTNVDLSTYCPFKGYASYWCISAVAGEEPIVWAYIEPYVEVEDIKGYAAFYGDKVTMRITELAPEK